jgi:cell division septal protein FtsQ
MSPTTTRPRPASGASARQRTAIDPRISARRKAVTRQQGRRRLVWLVVLGVVSVLVVGGWFVLHAPWFSARTITVQGATHETPAQVIAAGGLATHPALIDVHAGAVAQGIERLPWVHRATVTVAWPNKVHITVTEQVPVADMKMAARTWALLTASGRVLAVSPTQTPGLPVLTGPQAPGPAGSTLGAADQVGLSVAATLPVSFKAQVFSIGVQPGQWVQLALSTPVVVNIGSAGQLPSKYEDVTSILAGATLHAGDVIDVSVPDAPTVTGP